MFLKRIIAAGIVALSLTACSNVDRLSSAVSDGQQASRDAENYPYIRGINGDGTDSLLTVEFDTGTVDFLRLTRKLIAWDDNSETYRFYLTPVRENDNSEKLSVLPSVKVEIFDLALTGDTYANTVTATITNLSGYVKAPIATDIILYASRYGSFSEVARNHTNDLRVSESCSETIIYYTYVYCTSGIRGTGPTYKIPFNKIGEKYLKDIQSPVTGAFLPYDISATWTKNPVSQQVPWPSTVRDERL